MQNSSNYSSILVLEASQYETNKINYFDPLGNRKAIEDSIVKVEKREDKEYVLLKSGLEIPLEHIHSVDGEISPFYTDEFYKCDCV